MTTPDVPADPDDLTELDHLDAAELLREDWLHQTTEYDDYDEEDEEYQDDDFARSIAQDVAPFPGLSVLTTRGKRPRSLRGSGCHEA